MVFSFSASTLSDDCDSVQFLSRPVFVSLKCNWLASVHVRLICWSDGSSAVEWTSKKGWWRAWSACTNINESKKGNNLKVTVISYSNNMDIEIVTYCSLMYSKCCFGVGRQNLEHWSKADSIATSLDISSKVLFFTLNPNRRRRASALDGNKVKIIANWMASIFMVVDWRKGC